MKFCSKSEFVSWFETQAKKKIKVNNDGWISPSACLTAAKVICKQLSNALELPSPYDGWCGISDFAKKIWDKNMIYLSEIEAPASPSVSYASSYSSSSKSTSNYSSHGCSSSYSGSSSSSYSSSSSGSGMVKRHNFDSALRKIQRFSNEVPYISELEKFETDGGLFGWGDHYVNGREMNNYVEKVQDLFRTHNDIIIKTIQEFRDVYSTFDYLDKEYLSGIVQTATAAAKASEGAKVASNQAKEASDQAKIAADKALKNEVNLQKDVENLRKLVEKIKSIKEDLSNRISKIESILNDIQISNSGDIVLHSLPNEKKYNRKLFIAYAIGAAGLIVSLCSLVL